MHAPALFRHPLLPLAAALLLALPPAQARAQAATLPFSVTRVPTSTIEPDLEIRGSTVVRGINDSGQYVGSFGERNWTIWNLQHGFIHGSTDAGPIIGTGSDSRSPEGYRLGVIQGPRYADPGYRYLDLAPAANLSDFNDRVTQPNAINNAGVVVGHLSADYLDRGPNVAFRYDTTTRAFATLAVPGALSSEATDINASGQIVGNFTDATGDHGFLFSAGVYTVIDMPGELGHTRIGGINDAGSIVGSAYDYANASSFIYRNGVFQTFTADNLYTVAADINNAEQVVGWVGVSGQRRGFVYQAGTAVILDLSANGQSTYVNTINNLGVVGGTVDGVGFLATLSPVPEPASWALMGCGVLAICSAARRRPRGGR